ncbi:MAG: heterodisulfide reductase [Desulfobacteraceae bacterium]|nr:MAG: heterodisulfide reductase [Desulfobacteraceae bacterium]
MEPETFAQTHPSEGESIFFRAPGVQFDMKCYMVVTCFIDLGGGGNPVNKMEKAGSEQIVRLNQSDFGFTAEVIRRSGVNIHTCWQCRTCSSGCPFVHAMERPPNYVIRLVQLGLKKEALETSGIWICVGCNTCSVQCPNCIDISAVNDVLRRMAIEERVVVPEPNILDFHRAVLQSIKRHGRTHKLEVMLRYRLKRWDLFSDLRVGFRMLAKRKLELLPSRSSNLREIKKLFEEKKRI